MNRPLFITGIGTGVGKTIVAAILVEALQADYWKPIQAGFSDGSDTLEVESLISNFRTVLYKESYKLKMAASPHIAARAEGKNIDMDYLVSDFMQFSGQENQSGAENHTLIIEGAGGLMVPLNEHEFVINLIEKLNARVILVSRNYLGSINHSLLSAAICRERNIEVMGWIFNDHYLNYEEEIAQWSSYPKIASIPFSPLVDKTFISNQAAKIKEVLRTFNRE